MQILLNNELVNEPFTIDSNDRAFQYGDGLFETIAIRNYAPRHLNYHLDRLQFGAKLLSLNLPFKREEVSSKIAQLVEVNKHVDATVKIIVWRKNSDASGYSFNTQACNFLVVSRPFKNKSRVIDKAGFAETVAFHYSAISQIKTLNALPYVMAMHEKQERGLDELIVLNGQRKICESTSSNVFWVKDDIFYTPPISSGCLDGVARRVIIEKLKKDKRKIKEVLTEPKSIEGADCVFTTNSGGIRFISQIDHVRFDTSLAQDPLLTL
ncbi:hypothetical protein E1176_13205 [Fulvivirga sp. RKSG066]|uniref:aminotransferase class IV n=1 Tax=Fulvivirga aurantia TaxID=2529383 RepID=UPI0012BCD12C|nr:aminotransferase class IV [Fulvivirga aurantia]MTI21983.1 hypothetical protein [Fulvivirga aurantia]